MENHLKDRASYASLLPCSILITRIVSLMTLASHMGWLRSVGSLKLQVSFAKEPYKRDDILQERPIFLRSLLIVATPQPFVYVKGALGAIFGEFAVDHGCRALTEG